MKKVTIEVSCDECGEDLFFKDFYLYEKHDSILIKLQPHQCKPVPEHEKSKVSLWDPKDRKDK